MVAIRPMLGQSSVNVNNAGMASAQVLRNGTDPTIRPSPWIQGPIQTAKGSQELRPRHINNARDEAGERAESEARRSAMMASLGHGKHVSKEA